MVNKDDITVIMPTYNEEKHIRNAVQKVVKQKWAGNLEIVVVDGSSTDKTVDILQEMSSALPENRSLKILNNPVRHIPVSLNIACRHASHDIIVRTDAHTYVPEDYVLETVKTLEEIHYQGIAGGRITIDPGDETCIAKAISCAVSHPLGVGNAAYRTLNRSVVKPLAVDTVPFGAFSKSLWEDLGGYDESLLFDEDYDLNYRARQKGFQVVLNPRIELKYFARQSLTLLWQQYFRYGYWAFKFCRKHNVIPSVRRFIPAAFVVGFFLLLALGLIWNFKLFGLYLLAYFLPIITVSLYEGIKKKRSILFFFCLIPVFPVLHFSYGLGSILSIVKKN